MKKLLMVSAALLFAAPAFAQVQENLDLGAVIGGTGTYNSTVGATNSAAQTNSSNKGVLCQLHQISSSGTATVTFAIQSQDAASGLWSSLLTSGSITNVNDTYLAVYPGMQTSSLPSGWSGLSLHLPRTWRVQQVIGGTAGPAWNLSIGCNLLN